MSERMSGPAIAEERAAATAATNEVQRQADEAAMGVIQEQALEDNRQFNVDQRAQERAETAATDKRNRIQDRIDAPGLEVTDAEGNVVTDAEGNPKPTVRALNYQAEKEIFGSRGETRGYVDDEGKPLTEPVLGVVDKIRGVGVADEMRGVADEMRENRRYGTTPDKRNAAADAQNAAADAYEADQGVRNREADNYAEHIEDLRDQGFELTQAKLIADLALEIGAGERQLFDKLVTRSIAGRDPSSISPEEATKIRQEASGRVLANTVRNGDNLGMLTRIIKDEGIFSRDEYDQFRYKQGNPKRGEKKQFTRYRQESIGEYKDVRDHMDRADTKGAHDAKKLLREQMAARKAEGRGEEPIEPIPVTDSSPRGLRARVRDTMLRAAVYLGTKAQQAREYFNDEERGDGRKALAAASVVGVVALAGFAYLDLKSGSHTGDLVKSSGVKPHHHEAVKHAHEQLHAADSVNGGTPAPEGHDHVRQGVNGGTTAHVHEAAAQHKVTLSLGHEGDTIEGEVARNLHTDLKDPSVSKVTEVILHNQGISWEDARHLPIGYSFNMPPQHMIEELLKNK